MTGSLGERDDQNLASQSFIRDALNKILSQYRAECLALDAPRLRAMIHFGSTAKEPLPLQADIDLMLVFDELPGDRRERHNVVWDIETNLETELRRLWDVGYYYQFSSILKTRQDMEYFSPLFLDMTRVSRILHDDGIAAQTLERTRKWIARHKIERVEKGLRWYWICREQDGFPTHTW